MLIVRQDGEMLVNFECTATIGISGDTGGGYSISASSSINGKSKMELGRYGTKARAVEVLKEIADLHNSYLQKNGKRVTNPDGIVQPLVFNPPKTYFMPEDASVHELGHGEKERKSPTPEKRKYGEYGWVRLTDEEYASLVSEFGEDTVKHYIIYVDESAQKTSNKNKWKDFNLVIRNAIREKWGGGFIAEPEPKQEDDEAEIRRMEKLRDMIKQGGDSNGESSAG